MNDLKDNVLEYDDSSLAMMTHFYDSSCCNKGSKLAPCVVTKKQRKCQSWMNGLKEECDESSLTKKQRKCQSWMNGLKENSLEYDDSSLAMTHYVVIKDLNLRHML